MSPEEEVLRWGVPSSSYPPSVGRGDTTGPWDSGTRRGPRRLYYPTRSLRGSEDVEVRKEQEVGLL